MAFSPDGRTLASGGTDTTVRLWFSPDGQTLASGCANDTVRWNAGDGRERARLAGHGGRVWSVAFSPDGQTLASGGEDATVRLWNAGDGRERGRLAGHGGRVWSVAFSLDGQTLASGGEDATVRLWDARTGRCLAILCGNPSGAVTARPDGRYRAQGYVGGQFWHVIGLHRYDVGELDALIPGLRLTEDEPLWDRDTTPDRYRGADMHAPSGRAPCRAAGSTRRAGSALSAHPKRRAAHTRARARELAHERLGGQPAAGESVAECPRVKTAHLAIASACVVGPDERSRGSTDILVRYHWQLS